MSRALARVRRSGEQGAALVLAILFVLVVSVTVTAVLDLTDTSLRSGSAIGDNRKVTYSLDAAVDGAIRQVRTGFAANQGLAPGYGGACDAYNAPSTNGAAVTVSCAGEQGVYGQYDSGGVSPAVNPDNVPPVALQTTANTGEPGIALDANGVYRIHGSVQAASSVRACTNSGGTACSSGSGSSALQVEGTVTAQSCVGDITTYGPPYPTKPGDPAAPADPSLKHCPGGVAGATPDYPSGFTSPPASRSVPGCPAGYLVTFSPGTYTDAAALNLLTNGGCPNRILWFQPGNYFFRFSAAAPVWTFADASVNVVGGTPFGWSPTAATRPSIPKADNANPYRHACTTEYDALPSGADPDHLGVSFVLTGESRLSIEPAGGNVELCAQPSSTGQQIAVYGMPKRGNLANGSLGATGVSGGGWSNLSTAGLTLDGLEATGTTPSGGALTATWTGFNQLGTSALPASATITKVLLRVGHTETSNNATVSSVTANVTAADGTVLPAQSLCGGGGACTVQSVDVTRYLDKVAKLRNAATGAGPTVSFTLQAATGKSASESLDGAALDVYWLPKAMSATGATGAPAANVVAPAAAQVIDGVVSTTNAPAANSTTTTTLTGYALSAADLPAGASIQKVVARVAHVEAGTLPALALGGTAADGTTLTSVPAVSACTTSLTDCSVELDLTTQFATVAKLRSASGSGPTLTWAVRGKNTGTGSSQLDGVRLEVSYVPDSLGSASGCVAATPYSTKDASTCALLRAQGNNAFLALHGTVYAPAAAVDLKIMNGGTTVFGRGAIVRTLRLFFNPSVVYTGANITIETPDYGSFTRHDRVVDFWACSPRQDGTRVSPCTDSLADLHVVASFADASAGSPVTIRRWSHRRD